MMINEFRAWLDGFKEAVGDAPTPEQWAKVLAKLGEVRETVPMLPYTPSLPTLPSYPGILSPVWCGPATSHGHTAADAVPAWLKGATLSNLAPMDAVTSAAIFSDVESLYEH